MKYTIKQNPLTMLRGFLSLAIIWGHLQAVPLKIFGIDFSSLTFVPGRVIVWLFFVVSGFSIYTGYRTNKYSINTRDILRFYFNRAIRILPLFYLTVLLTWICNLYLFPETLPPWKSILRTLFFLDFNFNDGIFLFTPTWFIGVLVYFYLLSPFIIKGYIFLSDRLSTFLMFICLLGVSIILSVLGYLIVGTPDIRNIIGCLPFFLFGFFAFDLIKDHPDFLQKLFQRIPRKLFYLFLLILFELIFLLYYNRSTLPSFPGMKIAMLILPLYIGSLGVTLIVVLLSKKERPHKRKTLSFVTAFFRSIFYALGYQAFGIYLWHSLVVICLFNSQLFGYKGPPFHSLLQIIGAFFITTLFTYVISTIHFYLVEKPYQNLYKNRLDLLIE